MNTEDNAGTTENTVPADQITPIAAAVATIQVADDLDDSANDDVFETDMDENLEFLPEEVVSSDADETPAEEAPVDMADILDDKVKVNKGVLVTYRGKTKVRLARMNNAAYQTLLQKLYQANKHAIDAKTPEAEKLAVRCTLQAAAKCIVKDWDDMHLAGEAVPYSPKAALYLLQNSDDFKKFVETEARKGEHYFKQSTQEDKEHLKQLLLGS